MDVLGTYMIVRKYFENHDDEVIRRGLSLDEAKDHCADDDSSSESCYTTDAIDRTRKMGRWFDCFYKEE